MAMHSISDNENDVRDGDTIRLGKDAVNRDDAFPTRCNLTRRKMGNGRHPAEAFMRWVLVLSDECGYSGLAYVPANPSRN